jgi:hypothetical protein
MHRDEDIICSTAVWIGKMGSPALMSPDGTAFCGSEFIRDGQLNRHIPVARNIVRE